MTVRRAVLASLRLLSSRDRRVLVLATMAQMSTAFLDLSGVLLIGLVTAVSISAVQSVPLPTIATGLLDGIGVASNSPLRLAATLAWIAAIVLILKSVLNVFLTRRILHFLANRQAMVSARLSESLLALPLLQVQRRSSQQTAYTLTTAVSAATLVILGQGVIAATEIALLVVLAAGLLIVSPIVTIFTIVFFISVALVLQRVLARWASRIGYTAQETEVASISLIQEALRSYREIVVANRRIAYVTRFQALRWQTASVQADMHYIGLLPKYIFEIALVVGAGLLALTQFLTRDVSAAIAIITIFLAAGSRVVPSMLRLQGAAITVRSVAGQAAPAYELADELDRITEGRPKSTSSYESAAAPRATLSDTVDFVPSIRLSDIEFTYPGARRTSLDGVSLDVPPGASLAIVGSTGSGKSTLADVILGVIHPDNGQVLVGGLSPEVAVSQWPGGIAYVPQDVSVINGSIRENVALGLESSLIDDDQAWEALERARLASLLAADREGLDTVVGEHGAQLSGGQRQRLGLARALYTRPRLIVLDEATSALDAETESEIASTLQSMAGEVTTVTIAHRLATIRHCDLVVYLEHGQMVASGSFDEVRRAVPSFDRQAGLLGL